MAGIVVLAQLLQMLVHREELFGCIETPMFDALNGRDHSSKREVCAGARLTDQERSDIESCQLPNSLVE